MSASTPSTPARTTGAPTALARAATTASASAGSRPITSGTPGLAIPAFSAAIETTSVPRYSSWSSAIDVIAVTIGLTRLVASSRPPSPTSITPTSTPMRANHSQASRVANSKCVSGMRAASRSARSSPTRSTTRARGMVRPPARMRSVKSTRCGEV